MQHHLTKASNFRDMCEGFISITCVQGEAVQPLRWKKEIGLECFSWFFFFLSKWNICIKSTKSIKAQTNCFDFRSQMLRSIPKWPKTIAKAVPRDANVQCVTNAISFNSTKICIQVFTT